MDEEYKFKEINDKTHIFDSIRKKYILLTPEEWVRQTFLKYLISEKKYSKNLIKIESGLKYNALSKRSDILAFDRNGNPFLLVECKAEAVKLDQKVVDQVSRYNLIIKARYFAITNGKSTFCFELKDKSVYQITEIPDFET